MQEHHRIEGRDIDALRQAPGIGKDAAFVLRQRRLEPLKFAVALQRVVGAVDMVDLHREIEVGGVHIVAVFDAVGQHPAVGLHHLGNSAATFFDAAMSFANATARRIGTSPGANP